MTKKSDAPAIRFKGFSDAWEQRKVGDLLIERNQQAPMSDEYPLMAFIASEGVAPKGERYDRSALVTDTVNKLYKKTEKGDFIYSSNNLETGSIGLNKYGKACISPVYSIFEPTGIADSDFLGRRLVRKDFINAMVKWRQGVIYGQWRIHESDFLKIEITVPSVEEQRKIGAYLDQLDNLITLHQRECISFTGRADRLILTANKKRTTSSWEQRKLGELGTITTGNTPSTSIPDYYSDDGIVWVTPTDICENITFESARKLSDLGQQVGRVVPKNTILVTCIASIGKNTMLGNTGSFNQQINGLTPNENKYDPYFLLTESALWSAKMKGSAASGTMQIVNRTEFSELKTWLPSLIEQQAIGAFFKQLDNLITLHQRQPFSHSTPDISLSVQLIHPLYTSSWEQRKVSDLAEKTYGGGTPTTSNEAYWNGDIPWIQSSDVVDGKLLGVEPRKWITQDGLNSSAAQLIPGNSIAIITRVGVGKLAFMPYSYATSQDFLSLSKLNAEPLFTVYACYKKLQSELNAVQGTSIKGITKDELLAKNIMVPRYAEQQQIGAFFKQLDNLITLHQRKGKAAVSGCSNDANNSKGVCCKARDFGYKCHKKDESK